MTPRRPIGVRQGEVGSHRESPCFLLVAWDTYMTPRRMAMHFFIPIQIRENGNDSPD
jgi:hypothetical protein